MNRKDLLAVVPIHSIRGVPYYVDLDEIPQPFRDQFWAVLFFTRVPIIAGVRRAAYVRDWIGWVQYGT